MLRKSKSVNNGSAPSSSPETLPRAVTEGGKTIIGEHISIEGGIRGKEDLVIEGSLKGSIDLEEYRLTVGPKGRVEAEIQAENVTISGRLTGNIKALGKVKITKDAEFNGEIKAKSISVEDGAYLKAAIELEREPEKKATPVRKPSDKEAELITLARDADKKE